MLYFLFTLLGFVLGSTLFAYWIPKLLKNIDICTLPDDHNPGVSNAFMYGGFLALTVFCVTGMVFDIAYDGNFSLDNYQFSKMVIGCIIVGLGFGLPTMIYHKDNLPMPFKIIIHMGTGCVIYTIVAYTVGWIGGTSSILHGIIAAIFQIALAFIIWGGFMLHYRNDARKMNEKIKEL